MSTWVITSGDDEAAIFTITKDKRTLNFTDAVITAILVDYNTGEELASEVQDEANPNADWSVAMVAVVFSKATTSTIPSTATKGKLQIKVVKDSKQTSWWFDKIEFRTGF